MNKNSILLSFDMLLNPMRLVMLLCSYSHKQFLIKQIDLIRFLRELDTLAELSKKPKKEMVFIPKLHRLDLEYQIKGIIRPTVKLEKLPPTDELKSLINQQPRELFELVKFQQLNGDDPEKLFSTLWILKEQINDDKIMILEERPEYVTLEEILPSEVQAYRDLPEMEIKHYPFLPRYTDQYRYRRFLLKTAFYERIPIVTASEPFGNWIDKNGLALYSIEKRGSDVIEDTFSYEPSSFLLEDGLKLVKQQVDNPLLDKIVAIQKQIAERDMLRAQLKSDLVMNLVGLHPLGSIPNFLSWFIKLIRYCKVKEN